MFHYAETLMEKELFARDLWNPDAWYVMTSSTGMEVVFGGIATLCHRKDAQLSQDKNVAYHDVHNLRN